ncbi:MAG: hypothetical protein J1F35_03555 [Erysipelotrichales bacterium]|nr:hypothetical protein [Erysipelotrichales bacterium]
MITNNSLKEYYVKLQELHDNAVNMLIGLNQALLSTSSEVVIPIINSNNIESEVRIPSFLYLENKLEELSTNFSNIFNMPNSGDAWISNDTGKYKLNMIRTNTAPIAPEFSTNNIFASITDNNFLKDLVSPKTFLKINIDNLPTGVEEMLMKKIVIYSGALFDSLKNSYTSYKEFKAAIYNYDKGTDYDEYDSKISMPTKRDRYSSRFEIVEVPVDSWIDNTTNKRRYKIVLDTLTYFDKEDSAITFGLKPGDYICLGNSTNIYKVKNVNTSDMSLEIEEYVGHTVLQTYQENSQMVFQIHNSSYSEYEYLQVPLEENQYIVVFLATIYNNVQSQWSQPSYFDLSKILIKDEGGNYINDEFGNHLSYLDYYRKYCTNIGDLILGLTQTAFPQVSNFSPTVLQILQEGAETKNQVNDTCDTENILQVVPINKHLNDDVSSEEIINLHTQKNELNAQIQTNQSNIDNVYNKLLTTDFSSQITITQVGLQEELNKYYSERTTLQKQLNSVIDSINAKSLDVRNSTGQTKYHIRGISNVTKFTNWLHNSIGENVELIGLEVEYKYKSTHKDTTSISNINQSIFTDWNRVENITRERKLNFNKNGTQGFGLEWVNYDSAVNIIKWNQIDIPISQGEDVVIRIRYKYNVGQPFINIYSPWSDELTMVFPPQYKDDLEISTILDQNKQDTTVAGYNSILINEGYAEHIHNKMISNEQTFFHMPENIYSGFNTPENNLISLKDKLSGMNSELEKWKTILDAETNSKFEIYLNYDEVSVLLSPNSKNKIHIYNSDHISNSFIKKEMNLVIKNTGESRLNFYSIFPGNSAVSLIMASEENFINRISNYDRVPIYFNNELSSQYLGQWIYFRMNNPWTKEYIYCNDAGQNDIDFRYVTEEGVPEELERYSVHPTEYMTKNKQVALRYRKRAGDIIRYTVDSSKFGILDLYDGANNTRELKYIKPVTNKEIEDNERLEEQYNEKELENPTWYIYPLNQNNKFLTRFEDIQGIRYNENTQVPIYLDEGTDITLFFNQYSPENFKEVSDYDGAFLYPNIMSKELILTDGAEKSSKFIEVGETLTIPIVFEYFCSGNRESVSKSLFFDIRNSLISEPKHYMFEVIGHNDYTSTNDIYSNTSKIFADNASDTI